MTNPESPPPAGRSAASRRFDHDLRQFADNLELTTFTALSSGIGLGDVKKSESPKEKLARPGASAAGAARPVPPHAPVRGGVQGATGVSPAAYAATGATSRSETKSRPLSRAQKKTLRAQAKAHAAAEVRAAAEAKAQQHLVNEAGVQPFAAHDVVAQRDKQRAADARAVKRAMRRLPLERKILAFGLDLSFVFVSLVTVLGLTTVLAAVKSGTPMKRLTDWLALPPLTWLAQFKPEQLLLGTYVLFFAYWLVFRLVAGKTLGQSAAGRGLESAR